jgi:hypothetical protein
MITGRAGLQPHVDTTGIYWASTGNHRQTARDFVFGFPADAHSMTHARTRLQRSGPNVVTLPRGQYD